MIGGVLKAAVNVATCGWFGYVNMGAIAFCLVVAAGAMLIRRAG